MESAYLGHGKEQRAGAHQTVDCLAIFGFLATGRILARQFRESEPGILSSDDRLAAAHCDTRIKCSECSERSRHAVSADTRSRRLLHKLDVTRRPGTDPEDGPEPPL